MSDSKQDSTAEWKPPAKIEELFDKTAGSKFAAINAPTAGARTQQDLPVGNAPLQLYSLGTPNGQKVSILLEELGVDYDAHTINIGKGDQFTSGFVSVNPNSKIPALLDKEGPDGKPINIFESASIDLYLVKKYNRFFPEFDARAQTEITNWIMWQMGGLGPFTGQFGHYFVYAPADKGEARDYGVARYGMEVQRLLSVLDQHLGGSKQYLVNNTYSLADIIVFPWIYQIKTGYKHSSGINAGEFLSFSQYKHVNEWVDRIAARPAVQRGLTVNSFSSPEYPKPWLAPKKEEGESK